ncbi:MAG: hypothetical protein ABIG39_00635, partial [Candidatus Micrarchaeota archaeon]
MALANILGRNGTGARGNRNSELDAQTMFFMKRDGTAAGVGTLAATGVLGDKRRHDIIRIFDRVVTDRGYDEKKGDTGASEMANGYALTAELIDVLRRRIASDAGWRERYSQMETDGIVEDFRKALVVIATIREPMGREEMIGLVMGIASQNSPDVNPLAAADQPVTNLELRAVELAVDMTLAKAIQRVPGAGLDGGSEDIFVADVKQ